MFQKLQEAGLQVLVGNTIIRCHSHSGPNQPFQIRLHFPSLQCHSALLKHTFHNSLPPYKMFSQAQMCSPNLKRIDPFRPGTRHLHYEIVLSIN